MKTATEIMMESGSEIERLKAVYLYKVFGSCVVQTPEGFTLKPSVLFRILADLII